MSVRNGSATSAFGASCNDQMLVKQETAASSKQLLDAALLIACELDHDEQRDDVLDELTQSENGYYHFEKNRLQLRRTVPIPQAIIDQYDHLECKSFVGLFPEIHRAFITIDNKLFLWNYYDGNDFYVYDELSQIIISVALLKPKPGVFVSSIQHILVLSTPVEILMFAVKFDADNVHNPLQLFPTQFTVPSDNVHMTAIVGTEQGRIFLCGRDGGIYELDYWSGEEGGWFSGGGNNSASSANGGAVTASSGLFSVPFSNFFLSNRKKCRKVNHTASSFKLVRSILPVFLGGTGAATASDHHVESIVYDSTRNFLYTLGSEPNGRSGATKPIISVYELGHDGWGMKLRSRNDNILDGARAALRQVSSDMYADLSGSGVDLNLVHLSPIPSNESASIILMAVTSHGHRLYFDLESRSDKLRVKIVRLCPPAINPEELHRGLATSTAASSAAGRAAKVEPRFAKGTSPSLVHSAYYKDGILLMADAGRSALGDSLVSIHKDPRPVAAGGAASAAASSSYGGRPWGVGSSSTTYVSALNETIDSFDFESRIADVGEVHQASSLNLLSSSLFARANASAFSSRYTVAAAPRLVQLPKPLAGLTELATQHITPNRQLLILTSSSLLTLAKIRPLDELKHALSVKKRTGDEGALMQIWHKYGAKEACAMCLTLVGANYMSAGGVDLDDVEKRSGQVVNGHAGNLLTIASPNKLLGVPNGSSAAASALSSTGVTDEQIRKAAKQAFFRFGELQQESAAANAYRHGAAATSSSAKLEGVALYLSRWLRSHWDWSLCVLQSASSSAAADSSLPVLAFRFSKDFYLELLQPLVKLQRFLEESQRLLVRTDAASLSSAAAAVPAAYGGAQSGLADPARMELENFNALSALLNLTIEVFNLLLLFLTYAPNSNGGGSMSPSAAASQLLRTSTFLVSSDLQLLKDMKFYDVVTTAEGHALVRKLINTIAYVGTAGGANAAANDFEATSTFGRFKRGRDAYASDDASNQLISQLHTACPTFFGSSDLLYYNALDSLKLAKQQWNMTSERASHIGRALQTYHSFLHASSFPLEDIADKLKGVYEYSGIVELAMRRAELMERREVAKPKSVALGGGARAVGATTILHANGQGAHLLDDEYYAYQRKRCFDVILDTMNILMFGVVAGKSISGNGASSEPRGLTSTTVTVDATIPPLSPSELSAVRDRVVAHILASVDPQLHQSLYLWYIEKGLLPDLYAIQSEHLIRFLTSSEEYVMILKDYYLRNERWHEAALLLNYLSLKRGAEYTLKERVDFLTGSIGCARNFQQQLQRHGASPAGRASKRGGGLAATQTSVAEQQDLIDQLKDRIEIAKIQADIYKKLKLVLDESYSDAELQRLESRPSAQRDADLKSFADKKDQLSGALVDLDSSLLDLQQLYLFCTNFGLWECCLLIFKFSNESQRSDVICALWKNIFRSVMTTCKRAGQDWGESVATKFVELASDRATNYRDTDFMFPIDFLLRELEINNFRYRSVPQEAYVSETMMRAGIAPNRLLQQYDDIIDNWEQQQATDAEANTTNAHGQTIQTFLYWSVWHILRTILDQERNSARRSTASSAAALNLFNKCRTNLRTLPPSTDTTRLATRFQELYEQFLKQTR